MELKKYTVETESDILELKSNNTEFSVGDIIVHKPFDFPIIVGLFKEHFPRVVLFPISPGTEPYTVNGYNTSAVKEVKDDEVIQ